MKKLLFPFLLFLVFISCKKQETEPPVVTIFSPLATDSFYMADSIRINFSISDKNLASYKIIISNFFNHKIYYEEELAATGNSITIDKNVSFAINADTTAYINVLGIDKNGNTGGAAVKFKIKR